MSSTNTRIPPHFNFHNSCNHDYTINNHNNFQFIFRMAFSLYILNIIPAMVADILIFRNSKKKKASSKIDNTIDNRANKWYLIASVIISVFYITLFFPWTIDVFGGYFEPPNTLRTEQFFVQLLIPIILPFVVPVSIVSSLLGGLVAQLLINSRKLLVQVLSRQRIKHGDHLFN